MELIRPDPSPTIRERVLALEKNASVLIEDAKVSSVSPIACRTGAECTPRRRFITRQQGAGVRVWRAD